MQNNSSVKKVKQDHIVQETEHSLKMIRIPSRHDSAFLIANKFFLKYLFKD